MVNVTGNRMRILVVFVDVYEKCDHCCLDLCLFMGIFSVMVFVSHSGPKFLLGLNFSVCMCLLVKQKQKQSRKCGPSDVCIASQKQNRNMQVFTLYVSIVFNFLIVNCVRVKW